MALSASISDQRIQPAVAINGALKSENRDRWLRTEARAVAKDSSDADDEDDFEAIVADVPRHSGELNGELRIKGW